MNNDKLKKEIEILSVLSQCFVYDDKLVQLENVEPTLDVLHFINVYLHKRKRNAQRLKRLMRQVGVHV